MLQRTGWKRFLFALREIMYISLCVGLNLVTASAFVFSTKSVQPAAARWFQTGIIHPSTARERSIGREPSAWGFNACAITLFSRCVPAILTHWQSFLHVCFPAGPWGFHHQLQPQHPPSRSDSHGAAPGYVGAAPAPAASAAAFSVLWCLRSREQRFLHFPSITLYRYICHCISRKFFREKYSSEQSL